MFRRWKGASRVVIKGWRKSPWRNCCSSLWEQKEQACLLTLPGFLSLVWLLSLILAHHDHTHQTVMEHQPSPESSTFAATMLSNLHSCELNKLLLLNTQSRAFCSSYGDQTVIQEMYCWSARPAILELCCTSLLWNWAQKKMFLCFRGKIQDFLREKEDKRTLGLVATLGSVHWQSNQSRSQERSSYSPYILSCCTK